MFAPAFAPFANPEAIVNSKLALAFLDAGWVVDVISRNLAEESTYNYGSEWVEPWLPLKKVTHIIEYKAGSKLRRFVGTLWSGIRMRHPVVGCRWAAHAANFALRMHQEKGYDVIISRALPDFAHLPALLVTRLTGLPWIANWNDASGVKNPPPVGEGVNASLGFIAERFLGEVAKTASWHTFPSDRMRSHICTYLKNGTEQRSTTIPHIAFKYEITKHDRRDKVFTLCYAGNLYAGRNPDIFLKGFGEFIDSKGISKNCKLVFIGLENIGLTQLLRNYGLEGNTLITGPLSYVETLRQFSISDVLIVVEAAYTDGIYLPSKFVDYVQVGKPVLAVSPANGTLKDIIAVHGGGIAADCTSVPEIKRSLSELYSCWNDGNLDQKYGSEQLYKLFDPKTILDKYQGIFDKICPEKKATNLI